METSVNNKCRAFTSLEQSKKLAEILPIESADMFWIHVEEKSPKIDFWKVETIQRNFKPYSMDTPCWSLAALLDVLPKKYYPIKDHKTDLILGKPKDKWCVLYWDATGMQDGEQTLADNPIDACVEMIYKLKEKDWNYERNRI